MTRNNALFQIIIIASLSLYCIGLIVSHFFNPVLNYELSIYDAFPWYFWSSIILLLFIGEFIFIELIFKDNKSPVKLFSGISCIFFVNIIIILLPVFRGYIIYGRGDVLTHLGMIKDILITGYSGSENFYPFSHILTSQIVIITGIPINTSIMLIPIIFYIIYFIFIIYLADIIAPSFEAKVLILAFSLTLYFSYFFSMFLPTQLCFYYCVMILFLFFRALKKNENCYPYKILLVITIISAPFVHPLGTVFLFFFFLTYILILGINKKIQDKMMESDAISNVFSTKTGDLLLLTAITLISLYTWLSCFPFFRAGIKKIYNIIFMDVGVTPIERYNEQIQKTGFDLFQIIEIVIKNYGNAAIIVTMSIISIFLFIQIIRSKKPKDLSMYLLFSSLFVLFSIMFIGFSFVDFYVSNPYREFIWGLLWGCILCGLIFSDFISTIWKKIESQDIRKKIIPILLLMIILTTGIIGIYNIHLSPIILRANQQVSVSEMTGMIWFLNYQTQQSSITFIDEFIWRSPSVIWRQEAPDRQDLGNFFISPPHFGYSTSNRVNLTTNSYLVIDPYNTQMYNILFPTKGSFFAEDFRRLNRDYSLSTIYSEGDFTIYRN